MRRALVALLALAAAGAAAWALLRDTAPRIVADAAAVRVVDGDSLAVGERRVRLLGLDAPELHQDCRDGEAEVPCGRMAREALARLVREAGRVTCRVSGDDRFGRALATCTDAAARDLNREMVREGWALHWPGEPRYAEDEREAAAARRGIHALEFTPPGEWRRQQRRRGEGA